MRALAAEGRTVFISSHLMSEMAVTAERLIVIGRGRLIADTSVRELADRFSQGVFVRSPRARELAAALVSAGATVDADPAGDLSVHGLDVARIGDMAASHGIPLYEVTPRSASLEEAYMELTADSAEYRAGGSAGASDGGTIEARLRGGGHSGAGPGLDTRGVGSNGGQARTGRNAL
jgi:ABC-2 type transport system ATP-binding protein